MYNNNTWLQSNVKAWRKASHSIHKLNPRKSFILSNHSLFLKRITNIKSISLLLVFCDLIFSFSYYFKSIIVTTVGFQQEEYNYNHLMYHSLYRIVLNVLTTISITKVFTVSKIIFSITKVITDDCLNVFILLHSENN